MWERCGEACVLSVSAGRTRLRALLSQQFATSLRDALRLHYTQQVFLCIYITAVLPVPVQQKRAFTVIQYSTRPLRKQKQGPLLSYTNIAFS